MNDISTRIDRTGVLASVLCGIHCAIAPCILLIAPTLGSIWTHPLSHLAIGALVVPLALLSLRRGHRTHGKRWILAVGLVGVLLVVAGAMWPYAMDPMVAAGCDACCPSVTIDATTGNSRLHVPPASLLTLAGGAALVFAHAANLRCCARCVGDPEP